MTFLKKLGQIIAEGIAIIGGIAPIISMTNPGAGAIVQTVSKDLAQIEQIVIQIEAVGASLGLSGADKLRAAVGPVVQILMSSELLIGKPITDAAALNDAAQDIINGVVKALNAIHPDAAIATPVVAVAKV